MYASSAKSGKVLKVAGSLTVIVRVMVLVVTVDVVGDGVACQRLVYPLSKLQRYPAYSLPGNRCANGRRRPRHRFRGRNA